MWTLTFAGNWVTSSSNLFYQGLMITIIPLFFSPCRPLKNERVMLHRNLLLAFFFNDVLSLAGAFSYSIEMHASFREANQNIPLQVNISFHFFYMFSHRFQIIPIYIFLTINHFYSFQFFVNFLFSGCYKPSFPLYGRKVFL